MLSNVQKIKLLNIWPPYLFAGISVSKINENFNRFEVKLRMHWWNKNLFGTHFGGSLFAMCDPFFVFILVKNLGSDFIIWDKAASIKFRKPGKGTVKAVFEVPMERIEEIKQEMAHLKKKDYIFTTEVKDKEGNIIAELEKTIYVRRK